MTHRPTEEPLRQVRPHPVDTTRSGAPPEPVDVDPAVLSALLRRHGWQRRGGAPGRYGRWNVTALVSYAFDSGDASTSASYMVTDKKPIGQVSLLPSPPSPIGPRRSSHTGLGLTDHASRQPTS